MGPQEPGRALYQGRDDWEAATASEDSSPLHLTDNSMRIDCMQYRERSVPCRWQALIQRSNATIV